MMCEDKRKDRDCNNCNCISEIVEKIIRLQKNSFKKFKKIFTNLKKVV